MSSDKNPFALLSEEFKEFTDGLASLKMGSDKENEMPKPTIASKKMIRLKKVKIR